MWYVLFNDYQSIEIENTIKLRINSYHKKNVHKYYENNNCNKKTTKYCTKD